MKIFEKYMKIHHKQTLIFHDCVATCENISYMQPVLIQKTEYINESNI